MEGEKVPFTFSQIPRIRPPCKRHQTEYQEGCSGSIPEVFQLCSLQFSPQILGPKMGITLEHLKRLMSCDRDHLHHLSFSMPSPIVFDSGSLILLGFRTIG